MVKRTSKKFEDDKENAVPRKKKRIVLGKRKKDGEKKTLAEKDKRRYFAQIESAQKKHLMKTQMVRFDSSGTQKEFSYYLKLTVAIIIKVYLTDNVKSALWNEGIPAFLSPSAINIYFGMNTGKVNYGGKKQVKRCSYGTGAGVRSIGLDPRYATVNSFFPQMNRLRDTLVKEFSRRFPDCNCNFTHCAVKVYLKGQIVDWHTDMEFDNKHQNYLDHNSQAPNSVVAIVSFGDEKVLRFRSMEGTGKGTESNPPRDIVFPQKSGSILALHPADEQLIVLPCVAPVPFWWAHKARMVDTTNGVAVSLLFRAAGSHQRIYASSGKLACRKDKTPKPDKLEQFNNGHVNYEQMYKERGTSPEEIKMHVKEQLAEYF